MSPDEAGKYIMQALKPHRDEVARAKQAILHYVNLFAGKTDRMFDHWLHEQGIEVPKEVETDAPGCEESLTTVARGYSLRMAFYQAVWELIGAGELVAVNPSTRWQPSLEYRTPHGRGGISLKQVGCSYPMVVERPPLVSDIPTDPDIFLNGISCDTLHSGILVAIEQSLSCFRRGLYMPATAMLAAAAEATWIECGSAVATKLADAKLEVLIQDQYASISRKVRDTRKALANDKAKALLKAAGQSVGRVDDAELWTTTLRERRNALHWSKSKSFIVDHSGTASLLMAVPQHVETLESIRNAC